MARARGIKPGFFRDVDLLELPIYARHLFIGLWTLCDRAGRMEDKPKQIKLEIFPMDAVDCDDLLNQLDGIGVIKRYEVAGKRYLQVVNFTKHQNPHRDEKPSTIPEYMEHGANTVQAPCKPDAGMVAIGLTPDSLTPDSLTNTPPTPRKRRESFDAKQIETPEWLPKDLWGMWCDDRKARGKGITEQGAVQQIKKLSEYRGQGFSPKSVIEHSIAGGFQGLYSPPKQKNVSYEEREWYESKSGVEAKAADFGIGPWVEMEERWHEYKQRVMAAVKGESEFSIDQLYDIAKQRVGVPA